MGYLPFAYFFPQIPAKAGNPENNKSFFQKIQIAVNGIFADGKLRA